MPWKVIEFSDPTGEIMVARVPPEGTEAFVSGTQLIVQHGQVAALFHDGRPTDGFEAGRFHLTTENIPVLSKILNIASLSGSPFRSHVFFVALKTFTNLGWGTPSPILLRDTEFRMVNLRANGSFAIKIADPSTFLLTMVGTRGRETTFATHEYLRSIIASSFAEVIPTVLTTVLDLPRHYDDIAEKVRDRVRDDFDQYGLELVDFLVESVNLPEDVQTAINRAAGTRAVGDDELGRFERVSRVEALRDAASQPATPTANGLAGGLGIGAGMQIAREMAGQVGGNSVPGRPAGLTVAQVKGKLKELKELVGEGLITQDDFDEQKKRLLGQV